MERIHRALENLAVSAVVFGATAFRDKLASILEVMIDQNVLDRTSGTNYGRPYTFYHPLDAGSTAVSLSIALETMSELHDDALLARASCLLVAVGSLLRTHAPGLRDRGGPARPRGASPALPERLPAGHGPSVRRRLRHHGIPARRTDGPGRGRPARPAAPFHG